jgi:hypothetical protein
MPKPITRPQIDANRNVHEEKQESTRPVGPGPAHRGDRRDTHPRHSTGIDKRKGGKRGPSTRRGE